MQSIVISIVWLIFLCSSTGKLFAAEPTELVLSRAKYQDQLHGFWLAQCIANWTGLTTEMVRVEAPFLTDQDWGGPALKTIWGHTAGHSKTIDFFLTPENNLWAADDDTDIEYIYLHLLDVNQTCMLTGDQIRTGWLHHIYSNEDAPIPPGGSQRENFLWVSNETAYYLMRDQGLRPPATSEPEHNKDYAMIDAQLTTELFGLLAPTRPDVARKMAHLPIRTTAKNEAEWIAQFYVTMHSLASIEQLNRTMKERLFWMAAQARSELPEDSYPAKMYDFVKSSYENNPDKEDWEQTRDAVYQRYQVESNDGYIYKQPFDAGINYAASLVSLFYGEGDLKKTLRIGSLAGWDSDNPTATWGGLLGFMLGKEGVDKAFDREFPEAYWILRTRRNFPDRTPDLPGEDTFTLMAERGLRVIDRVVIEQMGGSVDEEDDVWRIPVTKKSH